MSNNRKRSVYGTPTPEPRHVDEDDRVARVLSILDKSNPLSLVNIIDPSEKHLISCIEKMPSTYLEMDEYDLHVLAKPSPMDNRIRMAFWYEIDLAIRREGKLGLDRVYAGLLTKESFRARYIHRQIYLAWMIRTLPSYESVLEEAVFAGLAQCRKILDAPLYNEQGKFINANARSVMSAAKIFQDRLHGGVVQKQQIQTQKVPLPIPNDPGDLSLLDSKIAQLENDIETTSNQVQGDRSE